MNSDPFAAVRLNKSRQKVFVEEPISQQDQSNQEDPFSSVRINKSESFPWVYETGRHAARIGSRIAETIGGIPGDVSSLLQSGMIAGLEKTGLKVSEKAKEKAKESSFFPTSSQLKSFSEEKSGGLTKAQGETEKVVDEYAETLASLLGPMKFRKALGVAAGSQLAKEGIKTLGLSEGSQEAGKLGTMLMLTAINPGGAMNYARSQYDKANKLSKGASIFVGEPAKNLKNLISDLEKGVTTPSKSAVIKPAEEILGKIKNGKILVEDAVAAKRDLNTLMKDPSVLSREKKLLKVVGKEIDNMIKPYEKINPAFSKAYRPAQEIYGAIMQGTKAYDFIKKSVGGKSVLGALAGELVFGHPEYIPATIASAGAAVGLAKTSDFFVRLSKSRELQKYYSNAMAAALKEDLPSLRKYAEKIEDEFTRNDKPHPIYREKNKIPTK